VTGLPLPQPADVIEAERRLRPALPRSPLWTSPALGALLGAEIWIKGELANPVASFKLRGALNHLLSSADERGACTASTGNHGQAVAYAARMLGRTADVFLPHGCPETKKQAIARFGGTLHVTGANLDEAKVAARIFAANRNLAFVDDGESPHVIAGAGTIGLEIARDSPGTAYVFAPTGSACLACGVSMGLKAMGSAAKVIAVQSAQSPCMARSFNARRAIEHPVTTICDCLNQRIPPKLSLACMLEYVAEAIEVDDTECLAAMHTLLADAHLLMEVGAAAALAGAWRHRQVIRGSKTVLIASGANSDAAMILRSLETPKIG
jgi:threonine dehydratase